MSTPDQAGFTSQLAPDQSALPQLNPKDPNYTQKVAELVAQMQSGGKLPVSPNSAPQAKVDTYQRTLFSEPDVDLPDMQLETNSNPDATSKLETTGSKKVLKFKDDIDDEVEMEVDLSETGLLELAKRARRAENMEMEIAAMRDEVAGKSTALNQQAEKVKRYLELEQMGDKTAIIDEMFKTEGGYEGLRTKIINEFREYEKLTDDEKRDFDVKRVQTESARRLAELEKRLAEREKSAEAKAVEAQRAQKVAVMQTVFNKYKFDNAANDPAITVINEQVFNIAQNAIRELEKQKVVITENILNREFKRAHAVFKGKVGVPKVSTAADTQRAIADQVDAAAAAAQSLQSTNPGSGTESDAEIMNRWIGLIKSGKLHAVTAEAGKSQKTAGLYAKLANMISKDRSILTRK